jgi:hypothetical protein
MRKVVTKFQKLIRKGERRKKCVKKVPLMVLAYLLCSQEEREKRVHCANTVSCMQPFSPGPCRFGLDSRQALKVSENMPFICDDQVPISLSLAHDVKLPLCAESFRQCCSPPHYRQESLERNRNGWRQDLQLTGNDTERRPTRSSQWMALRFTLSGNDTERRLTRSL